MKGVPRYLHRIFSLVAAVLLIVALDLVPAAPGWGRAPVTAQAREDETTSILAPTAPDETASAEETATGEMTPTEESSPLEVTPSLGLTPDKMVDTEDDYSEAALEASVYHSGDGTGQQLYATSLTDPDRLEGWMLAVFGPNGDPTYGDPFSPTDSVYWNILEGAYTYTIEIPSDYPYDALRVELFDPDTGNTATQTHVVYNVNGSTANTQTTCTLTQRDFCVLDTDTTTLYQDQDNPLWYVRVDENRPSGSFYDQTYNTTTLFRLYYLDDSQQGSGQSVLVCPS